MAKASWEPHETHASMSKGDAREKLPDTAFAFPKGRKEPLTDEGHVRAAMARFDQVDDVSDDEREQAFENIKKAAKHFGIDVQEKNWHDLGKQPHTKNSHS